MLSCLSNKAALWRQVLLIWTNLKTGKNLGWLKTQMPVSCALTQIWPYGTRFQQRTFHLCYFWTLVSLNVIFLWVFEAFTHGNSCPGKSVWLPSAGRNVHSYWKASVINLSCLTRTLGAGWVVPSLLNSESRGRQSFTFTVLTNWQQLGKQFSPMWWVYIFCTPMCVIFERTVCLHRISQRNKFL